MLWQVPKGRRSVRSRGSSGRAAAAFEKGFREAYKARKSGKALKPLDYVFTSIPVVYEDIPGARSLLPPFRDSSPVPRTCGHRQPLRLLTDTMAVCWDCGEQFEVKPLA